MNTPTRGEVTEWAIRLGFDLNRRAAIPQPLVERWNRMHPDRPYAENRKGLHVSQSFPGKARPDSAARAVENSAASRKRRP